MALSAQQQRAASIIYGLARQRGLPDARARELVAASYAESGLNPSVRNRSSGATGLFQLLSSGYVNRANQLGGVTNPRANTLAILGDYANYWRSHPNAPAGAAARDVERSGESAGFYSGPLRLLAGFRPGNIAPGAAAMPGGAPSPAAAPAAPAAPPVDLTPYRHAALSALLSQTGRSMPDFSQFFGAIKDLRGAQAQARQPNPLQPTQLPGMPTPGAPALAPGSGPVGKPVRGGKVIGTPGVGTHAKAFNVAGGSDNWESENANDIAVPVGTPIYAVTNGTIGPQFGSLGSGGRFAGLRLHLNAAGNAYYYAHLSRFAPGIRPGTRVRAGQLLGYSGSANGVAHLHIASQRGRPPT